MLQRIESKIKEIGRELYERSIGATPSIYDRKRWTGKVLEWAMKDEDFKVRLFRFIDVLPVLKNDSSVIALLKEYFSEKDIEFLNIFKIRLENLPVKGLMARAAARAIRSNVHLFSSQFIGGDTPEEALPAIEKILSKGYTISAYILGEVVLSDREAEEYINKNISLINTLEALRDKDRINLAVKPSSLYPWLDPVNWQGSIVHVKETLMPLIERLKELHMDLLFDMEHYYLKNISIEIFKEIINSDLLHGIPRPGLALQAYLKDTRRDIEDLITWAREHHHNITIRLVKGAYWDYETVINKQREWPVPVFMDKAQTDKNFEDLTRILLENSDTIYPAIATHNIRSIAAAIAIAQELELDSHRFEFQMLYGMAEPVRDALQEMGYRVRIYVPVGETIPGMAYLVRRLLENTSSESFLRKSFIENFSLEELIRSPRVEEHVEERQLHARGFTNVPLLDFSRSINRKRFSAALARIRDDFPCELPLILSNKDIFTEDKIISFNPARPEEIIGMVSKASTKEAQRAIEEARKAFHEWSLTSPAHRASILRQAAELLEEDRLAFAALEVYEVGKSWKEADADVAEAIDYLYYYASEMERLGQGKDLSVPGEINEYRYIPRGVGVVISPWNFPLAIPMGMVAASIVTGNTVILKPSGNAPVIAWKLVDLFRSGGLPPGVLQYICGPGGEVGEFLISHPEVDFIAFTGSREVGLHIVEVAGKTREGQRNVKRVIAEMGGKNAIIIDDTADLDEAVRGVLESAFGYQGQKCSACSRIIVLEELYEDFCTRFRYATESIPIGPPVDPENFMGPLIDKASLEKVRQYIISGSQEATLFYMRQVDIPDGYYIGPAIFVDVSPHARIAQEEIFGPIVSIIKVPDMDKAIEIANSTPYALTGGIYSRSPAHIEQVKRSFRVGNLYINRKITGAQVGRQPFGGFAMSGVGSKAGGPDYLLQFLHPISISENILRKGFSASTYRWK